MTTDREGDVGDAFGQVKNLDRVRVVVRDGSAPDAAIAAEPVAPTGDNGWYTGPFIVSATAVDDFDPAPSIEVSIDGGEFGAYAGPIEVTTDGEHVISARATDASGKVSETAEWSAKLDSTSPSVTATATWSPKLVTLTATDETSGVARLEYAVLKKVGASPSDWKAYTGPIRISDRKTVIAYRATDVAGNISATSEFDFLSVKNGRDFPMAQPQ